VLTWAAGIGWLWLCDAWRYLTGPTGYRGIIGIVATLVGAYVGLYAIMEARYERGLSRAAYQQSTFIDLVTSGNRGSFIAAMKTFGPIQMMEVPKEPKPWPLFADWWAEPERPNEGPLHTWALHFFPLCTPQLCGSPYPKGSENPDTGIRIDLDKARLDRANLDGVKLFRASLDGANLNGASLNGSRLEGVSGLTHKQLTAALWDEDTRWPKDFTPPCRFSTPQDPCTSHQLAMNSARR
jgi:hypothetical protein